MFTNVRPIKPWIPFLGERHTCLSNVCDCFSSAICSSIFHGLLTLILLRNNIFRLHQHHHCPCLLRFGDGCCELAAAFLSSFHGAPVSCRRCMGSGILQASVAWACWVSLHLWVWNPRLSYHNLELGGCQIYYLHLPWPCPAVLQFLGALVEAG